MEFLLIFGFSLIIVLPLISVLHSQYLEGKQDLDQSQLKQILDDISATAKNSYYAGPPSKATLTLYFPRGISEIETQQGTAGANEGKWELIIRFKRGATTVDLVENFPFEVDVTELSKTEGKRKIIISAERKDIDSDPGVTNLVEYVKIKD